MAYISKRDAHENTNGPEREEQMKNANLISSADPDDDDDYDDDYDDDLDGEDDLEEEEEDETFKKSLDTEFPLSGGETDEDA